MGYRKKVKKTVKKYANKRGLKRLGKRVIGKFIPGYNLYSTADDLFWVGNKVYNLLKADQAKMARRRRNEMMEEIRRKKAAAQSGRRKRYGIDDWW